MGIKRIVAVNTVSQIVGKAITGGTTFLISILLARALGTGGYGEFTKITTYVALFYLFADFGLNAAYLQSSQENEKGSNQIFSALIIIRVLLSIGLMCVALAVLSFLPGSGNQGYTMAVRLGIILFCPTIIFQSILTTANAVYQQKLRYGLSTVSIAAGSIASLIAVYVSTQMFLPFFSLQASILALLLGSFISSAVSLILLLRVFPFRVVRFDKKISLKLIASAFPLGITLLFNVVYFRIDSIVLTLVRSTQEVGFYGFAYKLFEFPLVIPTFFMNAVFPLLLVSWNTGNRNKFRSVVLRSAVFLGLAAIALGFVGWITAPLIIYVRPEFAPSIRLFRILLVGLPFFYLTSLTMWLLVTMKKRLALVSVYGCSMILNIISNILLIPRFGAEAAAWVTVFTELLVLVISWFFIKDSMKTT